MRPDWFGSEVFCEFQSLSCEVWQSLDQDCLTLSVAMGCACWAHTQDGNGQVNWPEFVEWAEAECTLCGGMWGAFGALEVFTCDQASFVLSFLCIAYCIREHAESALQANNVELELGHASSLCHRQVLRNGAACPGMGGDEGGISFPPLWTRTQRLQVEP